MKKIYFPIVCIAFFVLFFSLAKEAKAAALSGWAWSENIGWISVNCLNQQASPCAVDYKVDVDLSTGNFSGDAWIGEESPSGAGPIGWISFDRTRTGDPPGAPFQTGPGPIAKLGPDCGGGDLVCGWARALSACKNNFWNGTNCTSNLAGDAAGGWDGWIKMRGTATDGSPYGVSRSGNELIGWAWAGDVTAGAGNAIGWISFNCSNQGVCTLVVPGVGGPSDYKVSFLNNPPSATSLSVTNPANYCGFSSPPITLSWTFSDPGDTQSAYWIQVDNSGPGFPSPEVNVCVYDSTKIPNPIPGFCTAGSGGSTSYSPTLSFGTSYDWQVMVWDSSGVPSPSFAVGPSFTTRLQPPYLQPPSNDFTFAPPSPGVNEIIQFTDRTAFYGAIPSWAWDFQNDGVTDSTLQNPTFTYTTAGTYTVKLTAADSNGSCFFTKPLTATILPKWKEIAPTGWIFVPKFVFENLGKLLASVFQFLRAVV